MFVSWNVNGVKAGLNSLTSFFSLLSQHVHWDVALLQEVLKTSFQKPVLDDSFGSVVSSQSSGESSVVRQHSTAREVEIEAAHHEGYVSALLQLWSLLCCCGP